DDDRSHHHLRVRVGRDEVPQRARVHRAAVGVELARARGAARQAVAQGRVAQLIHRAGHRERARRARRAAGAQVADLGARAARLHADVTAAARARRALEVARVELADLVRRAAARAAVGDAGAGVVAAARA